MTVYYTKLMLKYLREEELKKNAKKEVDMVANHIVNSVLNNSIIGVQSCSFGYSPHPQYCVYPQQLSVLEILETKFPDITITMKTREIHGRFSYTYLLEW